jgi:putative PIN family toxin of toxin-antitoxin system
MRVLLDTNVLVSHLLTSTAGGSIETIMDALFQNRFSLLLPPELLDELERVAARKPHLAKRIQPDQLARLRDQLLAVAEVIPAIDETIPTVTRERKDDYLLAYSFVGEADYLVTGDDDLLVLRQVGDLNIISLPTFAEILRSRSQ